MPSPFTRTPYPSHQRLNTIAERYRLHLTKHPFLLFGLPFIFLMVSGSFLLTPATAVRYERFDRKTHMLDTEEALGLDRVRGAGKKRMEGKKRDIREEYWRLAGKGEDLDNWEVKRVERLEGEGDGTL